MKILRNFFDRYDSDENFLISNMYVKNKMTTHETNEYKYEYIFLNFALNDPDVRSRDFTVISINNLQLDNTIIIKGSSHHQNLGIITTVDVNMDDEEAIDLMFFTEASDIPIRISDINNDFKNGTISEINEKILRIDIETDKLRLKTNYLVKGIETYTILSTKSDMGLQAGLKTETLPKIQCIIKRKDLMENIDKLVRTFSYLERL